MKKFLLQSAAIVFINIALRNALKHRNCVHRVEPLQTHHPYSYILLCADDPKKEINYLHDQLSCLDEQIRDLRKCLNR